MMRYLFQDHNGSPPIPNIALDGSIATNVFNNISVLRIVLADHISSFLRRNELLKYNKRTLPEASLRQFTRADMNVQKDKRSKKLGPDQLRRRVEIGKERRSRTRNILVKAAYRVFASKGFDAPAIDEFIAEAGVSRGTFYNHFSTKEELAEAVADNFATNINEMILPAITAIDDPATRLSKAFRLFIRFAVQDKTRGWILVRMMPLVGGSLNKKMRDFVGNEFREAEQNGRLRTNSLPITIDLGLGLMVMTVRTMLDKKNDLGHIDRAAENLLLAMGLDAEEANEIAHTPLVEFDQQIQDNFHGGKK